MAYLATASLMVDKTVANSLIKCGLFPVFSSCWMTPTTISSLIPFVSYLLRLLGSGDGGGVCSYAFLPLLFGLSAKETFLVVDEVVDDRDRDFARGEDASDVCDRFTFFVGGCCWGVEVFSLVVEALVMEGR